VHNNCKIGNTSGFRSCSRHLQNPFYGQFIPLFVSGFKAVTVSTPAHPNFPNFPNFPDFPASAPILLRFSLDFPLPSGGRKRPIGSRISSLKVNGRFIAGDFRSTYVCVRACVCKVGGGWLNILAAGPVYIGVLVDPREVRFLGPRALQHLRKVEAIGRQLHDSFSLIGH